MSTTALLFLGLGSTVLWGGLILTLGILLHNERKNKATSM